MERVRVGSWHFKWCFLRLKVVCVCVYLVLLYAFVGLAGVLLLAGVVGWWRRFCLYFLGVPSVRYAIRKSSVFGAGSAHS